MPEEYEEGTYCDFFGAFAKIYTLSDESGKAFYVGCTVNLEARLATHLSEARANKKSSNQRKNEVIRSLNYNIVVKIIDMEWVTGRKGITAIHKARGLEKEWIDRFIDLGYDLTNRNRGLKFLKHHVKKEFIGQTFRTKSITGNKIEISEVPNEIVPQDIIGQSITQ